jgi:pimeloyl-ACP methyl ester carboxylesterase
MHGWLRVKQGELFFESAGQGEPVVFLQGFGLDSRMWTPQLQALQSKFRVIRYDLRGFGRSSLPPVDKIRRPSLVISGSRDLPDFRRSATCLLKGCLEPVARSSKEQDIWSIWRHQIFSTRFFRNFGTD